MPVAASRRLALAEVIRGYIDHLAVERGAAANTLSSYRRDLGRYLDYLDGRGVANLDEVDALTVGAFLGYLRTGDADHPPLSPTSAARALIAVRGLHRFAVQDGLLAADVAQEVRPPAPPRRLPKAISVADVERLLSAASLPDTPLAVRDRALLELLYGTGARISEAVGSWLSMTSDSAERRACWSPGKGGQAAAGAARLVRGRRRVEAYLVRARPALARTRPVLEVGAGVWRWRDDRAHPAMDVDGGAAVPDSTGICLDLAGRAHRPGRPTDPGHRSRDHRRGCGFGLGMTLLRQRFGVLDEEVHSINQPGGDWVRSGRRRR